MNGPIMIKVDAAQRTMDMSMPAGSLYGLPLDTERTPLLIDRLREFGATRVVIDVPGGLEHPFVSALREAGLMVAVGTIQPA